MAYGSYATPPGWRKRAFLLALRWKIKFFSKPEEKEAPSSRIYLRGLGFVGLLTGILPTVMQNSFWLAVCIFYFCVAFLCIDLVLEPLKTASKITFLLGVIAIGAAFTKFVALHKSPADFSFADSDGRLELTISNSSEADDYRPFDVTIAPDPDVSIAIGGVNILNAPASCSPINNLPDQLGPQEHTIVFQDRPGHWTLYPANFRIRCTELPSMSHMKIELQLVQGMPNSGVAPHPVYPRMAPAYTARFTGRFRVVELESTFKHQ